MKTTTLVSDGNKPAVNVGDIVTYTNGNLGLYTGKVMKINGSELVVIDPTDDAAISLYNAGCRLGDCISLNQIVTA